MPSLRTLLILGRTSNLPTVWSNCLAGWWLGGAGNYGKLALLFLGATALYLGGMFLNDAFDEQFDSQYRRERPIPSGIVRIGAVWKIGFGLLAVGLGFLFCIGWLAALLGLMLVAAILLYDAVHKVFTLSPIIMAACRFFLYLVATATGQNGFNGWGIWCGLALAIYIVGLSFIARKESNGAKINFWSALLLAAPIVLAFTMDKDSGSYRAAVLLSIVLILWIGRSLRFSLGGQLNIGRTVSGLLAGIVFVDLLALGAIPRPFALIFIALFLLALFFQRFIPAT